MLEAVNAARAGGIVPQKQTNKQTDNMTTAKITKSEGRANMFHH